MSDLRIPLNRLKFGHEDGAGINARVVGRQEGIAELAANLHAQGQIENLVVKPCGDGFYSVANGNRRLAAFHMIHGEGSHHPINCTIHEVDETRAFSFSLTTAITAKQLHPVDQYEAFAQLRDRGQTSEEIAREYGMSEREVDQALALGHLSPRVRDLWRKGELKKDVAQAFTLAPDHKTQEDVLDEILRDSEGREIWDDDVKGALKISDDDTGALVEFVGIDAYVARGGKVVRDLFGTNHQISDPKLAKKMAAEKLAEECAKLKEQGWSFAVPADTVRNTKHSYGRLKAEGKATEEEAQRLAELNVVFHDPKGHYRVGVYHTETFAELTTAEQKAYLAYRELEREISRRAYTPAMMAKAGCFIDINDDGLLDIEFGYVKPAQKTEAAKVEKAERKEQQKADAKVAKAEGKRAPEAKTLSNALVERLTSQLTAATRDAVAGDPLLAESPFAEILAKIVCAQIVPESIYRTPDAVRTKLPSVRQVLDANVFNAAIAKRFDAEDYFSSAPKGFVLKAIAEAINQDEARKIAGKTKPEIWKFALANVGKTGWLPKELRTVHYKGPGGEGYKASAAVAPVAAAKPEAKAPSTREAVKKAKAAGEAKKATIAQKRLAKTAAKKTAKKR
ncbi:ParB/RepB/Spo0J family partition protein [Bradyrhizobium liaoningense]|uniref:ParB/RepB/Spo0J family partition protein n=1 Tax=Bradyrhizobium liaoningense TaxID=43992 RepID=UPI0004B45DFE|nr:ParB N-terminal domain-containing protein [Bradyrhizobium liaoningense]